MASDVVREFTIRVNTKGQIEAIKGFEKLDDSIDKTNNKMGENDRKQKAVAQSTSNSTKAFAKQAQGLGGIVRIYATVAANVFALSSAYNLLKRNADLSILRTASAQLSVTTGQNFNLIADQLKRVTGGALAFREAMQSANLALSGGFSGKQATQIAEIATKAANALGRSVPEAVQRLTQAIVKGEPELADEFGIILRVTEATNEYARSLGKLPTQLTTAQRQQAIFNQFLEQGTKKFADVEIQTNPYDKLAVSFVELTQKIVDFIRVPLDPIIKLLSESGIALAGVFAAVAGGIAKLLLPELRNLSTKMVEVANQSKAGAFAKYTQSVEAAANAQKALNADVDDYVDILQSGIKKSKLDKIDLGAGIDSDQLARELDKASGNIGLEVRENILKNVFLGDEAKMRNTVGTFVKGLEKEIAKSAAKGFNTVSFGGFTGSLQEARSSVEALGIVTKTVAQIEKEAALSSEVLIRKKINYYRLLTAEVQKFAATVKFAATSGYAQGLEKGLFGSLANIKSTFVELSQQVGGGLAGRIAGTVGAGAKVAGGFLSTMTKLVGAFGQWGLVISVLTTLFSPLIDYLNLTDKNAEKIEKGLDNFSKAAEASERSIKKLGLTTAKSFEEQAEKAKTAANIINSITTNVENLEETFSSLQKTQNSFWRIFEYNADSAAEAISKVGTAFNRVIALAPKFRQAGIREEFGTFDVQTKLQTTKSDPNKALIGGKFVSTAEILKQANENLSGSGGRAAFKNGILTVTLPTAITEEQADVFARTNIYEGIVLGAEEVGTAQIKAFRGGAKAGQEALGTVESFNTAYKDLSTTLADATTKVNGASQEYTNVNNVLERYDELVRQGATEEANAAFKSLNPQMVAVIQRYTDLGDAAKNATPQQAVGAWRAYREELASFATNASEASSKQAVLNSKLIAVSDSVAKGNIGKITEEYQIQSDLIDTQIDALKIKNKENRLQLSLAKAGAQDSQAIRQRVADIANVEAQIDKLKADQLIKYSQANALIKQGVEGTKALLNIEQIRFNILKDQQSVNAAIASASGNFADKEKALAFEKQITAQKINQLNADIASKQAQLADKQGPAAQVLQEEIKLLQQKVGIEQQLSNIKQATGTRDDELAKLTQQNKLEQQILDTQIVGLEVAKKRADLAASNKFLSQQQRDAASLLSIQKDIALVQKERAKADQNIVTLAKKVAVEEAAIQKLQMEGSSTTEESVRLQNAKLALTKAENEARALGVDLEAAILAEKEKQYQLAKKSADPFKDPQQFGALMGQEFRRIAQEFGEKLGSTINRVVDVTLGVVDSGIDAFVDAVRNGEDALSAAKDAISDTFLDLNTQLIKDQFKLVARDFLGGIFPELKDLGKSEEQVVAEKQLEVQKQILNALSGGPTVPGGTQPNKPGQSNPQQQGMFDSITTFFKDTFAKVKDFFTSIGTNIGDVATKAIDGVGNIIDGLDLPGIFNSIVGFFSGSSGSIGGGGSGSGSDYAQIAQTAISLFLAKGGITGQLQNRVPMYANGTVTSGPELAMIGEGPKREAVVPLPDNRSIPVTIFGESEKPTVVENRFDINITGIQGNEEGIRRSASQVALQIAREQSKAQGRIG